MHGLLRTAAAAALAMGLLAGAATVSTASAQHVVTESEAGRLSFDALTAAPARAYVHQAQYYHHRRYIPRHRFYRHHGYRR
jgi:hypothetical protein